MQIHLMEEGESVARIPADPAKVLDVLELYERKSSARERLLDAQFSLLHRLENVMRGVDASLVDRTHPPTLRALDATADTIEETLACFRSAAMASRELAAEHAAAAFALTNRKRPAEVKSKQRGKGAKGVKEKKELAKPERAVAATREKAHKVSVPVTPVVAEEPEAPASTTRNSAKQATRRNNKEEKRPKREATGGSAKNKRHSQRVSKTPRAKPAKDDEPTYCFCNRVSFGEMIGCDNVKCEIEWFHFECIGLKTKPKGNKWFCPDCRKPDTAGSTPKR